MVGSVPGKPRHTSHTFVFGGSPSCPTAQPQNIFVRVRGWTCTSMPTTTSQPLANGCNLGLHATRFLVRTRHTKHQVLAPLRSEDLQSHGQVFRLPTWNA